MFGYRRFGPILWDSLPDTWGGKRILCGPEFLVQRSTAEGNGGARRSLERSTAAPTVLLKKPYCLYFLFSKISIYQNFIIIFLVLFRFICFFFFVFFS